MKLWFIIFLIYIIYIYIYVQPGHLILRLMLKKRYISYKNQNVCI